MMLEQYLGPARPREIDMTCTTKDYMVLPKYNETMRHLQLWGVQGSNKIRAPKCGHMYNYIAATKKLVTV